MAPGSCIRIHRHAGDLVMEGYLLTAFTIEGEEPLEQKCRELNVHIWQGAENEQSKG